MDEGAKRRLAGAAVLVALAVIFVPMLVEDEDSGDGLGEPVIIPDAPAGDAGSAAVSGDGAFPGEDLGLQLPYPETADPLALPVPEPPPGAPLPPPGGADPIIEQPVAVEPPITPGASPEASMPSAGQVAGPKPVPAGAPSWVVQVSSLGSPQAAQELQDKLRGDGFAAFVEQADVNGKRYYRVRIGPETERSDADRVARRLQNATGNKPLVQSYP